MRNMSQSFEQRALANFDSKGQQNALHKRGKARQTDRFSAAIWNSPEKVK
jgi:hypothetical protein